MKLFIPTSSLNFNNIMSCESISPFAFYMQRNFGYKTFEKVELNHFDNSLLLFESFPNFQIPKSELVNYPMVIEVDIDSGYDGLKKLENGIWQIDRTVYLNPFKSNIFFFLIEHKNTILSRSESSAETKLVNLYRNNIKVCQTEKKEFIIDSISDIPSLNHQEVESDNQKNKIKGFAYAYLIAANKSTSKENIQLKKMINEIINLSSAIINSVSGFGSQQQNDELKHLLQRMNIYQYKDVMEYLETTIPNQYKEVWNKLYNQFGLRIPNKYNFEQYYYSLTDKSKFETSIQELKDWSNQIIASSNVTKPKLEWNDIALAGNKLTQFEDTFIAKSETRIMYQNLINDIFVSTDITESSFSSEKSRLADEITRKIKSYIGDEKWKSHNANKYLNNLRRNIAGQEAFNINWNTGLISAIASFLLKGEDFEKLNDFLISSEIEDGRLAFGFYGCICGFANLSRLFTSNLYNSDLDYFIRTYKTIFKQLHNIELFGELPKEEKPKVITVKSKINVEENKEGYPNNKLEELIQEIEQNVPECSKLSKSNREFYFGEISKFYSGKIDIAFIQDLKSIPIKSRTKTNWNKIISFLNKKMKETKKTKLSTKQPSTKKTQEPSLFSNLDNIFYKDVEAFNLINQYINPKVSEEFKVDLIWFQEEYKKGDASNYYKKAKRDNNSVLEAFKRYIEKRKYVKNGKVSHNDIDKIIIKLKEKYL